MKTLIFDFDGTLADSFELVVDIAYDITGIPRLSDEQITEFRRMPIMKARKQLGIPLSRIPRLLLQGRKAMQQRIGEVHPFAGIPEALEGLQAQGHPLLVMSSNSEKNVRAFLRQHDMEKYFSGVYGNVGIFDKAGALRKVMRRNHLAAEECYYIGDEMRDIAAAQRVGVRIVSVAWGYQHPDSLAERRPDALIHEPAELLKVFK